MPAGARLPVEGDDEEMWRQRRQQHKEQMSAAVERALMRREEEKQEAERPSSSVGDKLKDDKAKVGGWTSSRGTLSLTVLRLLDVYGHLPMVTLVESN